MRGIEAALQIYGEVENGAFAAEALRTTQRPIFDIAMDLGYVSQQTFSRVFRREFDRTPSDYRHQA